MTFDRETAIEAVDAIFDDIDNGRLDVATVLLLRVVVDQLSQLVWERENG